MAQTWNDPTLVWQTWDGTNLVWKNPILPWNDPALPWKNGSATVIGGGGGGGVGSPMGLLLALTYPS